MVDKQFTTKDIYVYITLVSWNINNFMVIRTGA